MERGAAERGEPENREQRRHQQHAEDELAHRAAARDPRDEHADERRPGDPPAPIERRPGVLPAARALGHRAGVGPERQRNEVLEIVADTLDEEVEEEGGGAEREEEREDRERQPEVQLRKNRITSYNVCYTKLLRVDGAYTLWALNPEGALAMQAEARIAV